MVGGRGGGGGGGGWGGAGRKQERRALMVAFAVALLMGTAVYFRIWARQSTDPSFTVDDREELRRQFERANLEAMDESAEWRMKYDTEFAKNKQMQDELLKAKASLSASTKRFSLLKKDNEVLKRQIQIMKQQCNCTVTSNLTQE
ncbi:uncharacterized protein [Oryza sativa Japonica Group]|uniref:Os02g0805700 protein n=2 Tax=Oryza sativa subsp. japonica TaxID=39947 RepID=A3ACG4_ORYSJ|nr:uncharacterized protein LOC4331067 [Oryza sativa Japonica Group]KAB8089400.1 hypothetical protein EE612_014329 [Oryza sativa]EAZ25003.1 hypothetical protein OsJ_08783 [Oryza sativa Japonica Group]KAF2947522.1 hypothetical protein DAI22_02g374400 [Oryza sativa Japonica Group]BAD19380.1 unknown protein [Oryza sativa Japonica Group]BAD19428.1 unknown protein [Oryza sativa Japonica Group]|eukprot:NP_001048443.1 Os02g0805700 [Oryza sativa Japonica Group]